MASILDLLPERELVVPEMDGKRPVRVSAGSRRAICPECGTEFEFFPAYHRYMRVIEGHRVYYDAHRCLRRVEAREGALARKKNEAKRLQAMWNVRADIERYTAQIDDPAFGRLPASQREAIRDALRKKKTRLKALEEECE